MMIQLIMILIKKQVKRNPREKIRYKKTKEIVQNQINQNLIKEIREKMKNDLKGWKPQQKEIMMIQLMMILIKGQIMKNQRNNIIGKKSKKKIQNQINQTDERYKRENKELVISKETPQKGDDDDLVDTYTDRDTNIDESEQRYWIEESQKKRSRIR